MNYICDNITNKNGHICFAGQDTVELAEKYGTPLFLVDENKVRENCRLIRNSVKTYFGENSDVLYASKANCFGKLVQVVTSEGLGIDVVSCGEVLTAVKAGADMSMAFFHSNNKTDADIEYAMDNGVGYFVADNEEEVKRVEYFAAKRGMVQNILLRLTPGIDPHTYAAVATGKVDSKFGSAIETGQADAITKMALEQPHIKLCGFHCHVGSQVFGEDIYERAVKVMLSFIADMKAKYGFEAEILDMGGGLGVRYVNTDPYTDHPARIEGMARAFKESVSELGIKAPKILFEPGRSIIADAGMTLYTVGTVKRIPGYKNYVSIDGGMTDNPRYALYKSSYTCLAASKADEECEMRATLAGRCCESGDMIQENVPFPESTTRGDIVAVCTTGAYNYSMSSNYNRIPRPAIVMLKDGTSSVAVKRESFENVVSLDVF